ncbi:MAG: DNA/RNA non-specific endonuclease [Methylococcales bacterium]|nr:DNA/RNA non-specific endonuclease [Methylococcales bacterium]
MNKIMIAGILFTLPLTGYANDPCSGNKGGINHCEGTKFVCNDGSSSASTKDCTVYMGGNNITSPVIKPVSTAITPSVKPIVNTVVPAPNKPLITTNTSAQIMKLDYEGFTVWLDCEKRGAVKFQYNAQHDNGSFPRVSSFTLDPNVPAQCQQFTANSYGQNYDRGHLVPANHLDYSATAIKATNNMTNILPQAQNMNRGAWLQTEEIIECYRDISELLVIGGVIWGNNPADDYFVQSHGVKTPDAFWKVIVRGTGQSEQAIAWIVPNSKDAVRKNLDKYLVTVSDIERVTGEKIPVSDYAKDTKPSTSWLIPQGCNKG